MRKTTSLPLIPGEEVKERDVQSQTWAHRVAIAGAIVGGLLLLLSLAHLSQGLATRTGDSLWFSAILAFGIDASIVVAEAALVVATVHRIRGVKGWATAWLLISWVTSSALNAMHFTHDLTPWSWSWGFNVFLGALIPTGVFVLSKIGAALVVGQREEVKITGLAEAQEAERLAKSYRRKRERSGKAA